MLAAGQVIVQKPRTFCRPAGDRVLVETVLFNATQNARLHGGDAPVASQRGLLVPRGGLRFAIRSYQRCGAEPRPTPSAAGAGPASRGRRLRGARDGRGESTFLGLRDIMLAAKAMEPPAAVELRVEEDCVRFVMVCTLKVASDEEPPSERRQAVARPAGRSVLCGVG